MNEEMLFKDVYCNQLIFKKLQLSDHYRVLDIGLKYICIESKNTQHNSQSRSSSHLVEGVASQTFD